MSASVPQIVAQQNFLSQAASFGSTTLYTTPATGWYRMSVFVDTLSATGNPSATLGWTDPASGAQTKTTPATSDPGSSVISITTVVSGGTNITVLGTEGGIETYNIYTTVEAL